MWLQVNHRAFTPKKVYFYWVERDQNAPAYLQGVLRVGHLFPPDIAAE